MNLSCYFLEKEQFQESCDIFEWKKIEYKGDSFTPRTGHTLVEYKANFYLFGGTSTNQLLNDFSSYDIATKSFKKLSPIGTFPCPRSGAKMASNGSNIYIFGGHTNKEGVLSDLYKYEISNNILSKIELSGDVLQPLVDHSMLSYNKYLYIYGGKTQSTLSKSLFRINLEKCNTRNLKYSGDIPTSRFGHTANIFKSNMYIFGGWNGFETLDELFYFSVISNIWYEVRLVIGAKPKGRYRHSSVIVGKSLFIFGGVDQKQKKFNDLFEFIIERSEWRLVETKGSLPTPRSFHEMGSFENRIFIFGGVDDKKLNDVYRIIIGREQEKGFETIPDNKSLKSMDLFENEKDKLNFMEGYQKTNKLTDLLKEQVRELTNKLKFEQERYLCKICLQKEVDCVILNCGHKFSCYSCSTKYEKCLICQKSCIKKLKIFTI